LSRQEAIDCAKKLDYLGYRQIDPKKLSVLSGDEIWNAKYTNTEERNELLRSSSKTYASALRELEDKKLIEAQLAHTIKEIGE
jgi:hypothetical protein